MQTLTNRQSPPIRNARNLWNNNAILMDIRSLKSHSISNDGDVCRVALAPPGSADIQETTNLSTDANSSTNNTQTTIICKAKPFFYTIWGLLCPTDRSRYFENFTFFENIPTGKYIKQTNKRTSRPWHESSFSHADNKLALVRFIPRVFSNNKKLKLAPILKFWQIFFFWC